MAAARGSRSTTIAAPAERVWELVSDQPGTGAFREDSRGSTVTRGEPGRAFAVYAGLPVADWSSERSIQQTLAEVRERAEQG